jgi:hypothetical protein
MGPIFKILKKSNWELNYDKEEQKFIDEIIEQAEYGIHPEQHINALKLSNFLAKLLKDDDFNHIVDNHHRYVLSDSIIYQFPNFQNFVNSGHVTKQDYLQLSFPILIFLTVLI